MHPYRPRPGPSRWSLDALLAALAPFAWAVAALAAGGLGCAAYFAEHATRSRTFGEGAIRSLTWVVCGWTADAVALAAAVMAYRSRRRAPSRRAANGALAAAAASAAVFFALAGPLHVVRWSWIAKCERGAAQACVALGVWHYRESPLPNPALASRYLRRGCDLGSTEACGRLFEAGTSIDEAPYACPRMAPVCARDPRPHPESICSYYVHRCRPAASTAGGTRDQR